MSIKSDKWIRRMAEQHKMIEPFAADQVRNVDGHKIVSHEEWIQARTAFLAKEKEFTLLRDELTRQRQFSTQVATIPIPTIRKQPSDRGWRGRLEARVGIRR